MLEIKVKSATMTRVGRHDGDYHALLRESASAALGGLDPGRIDSVFFASFAPAELCGIKDPLQSLRDALAPMLPGPVPPLFGPYKTGGEALFHAIERCRKGHGDVLVLGCEKMTHVDAARAAGLLAPRVADPVENAHGATLPALAAMATRAYADAFRVPARAFDAVAVKNHSHAARNPFAHFRREVTLDEVAASPLVADPLRRHHCAPMSDGAAACVLSGEAPAGAVRLRGWGCGIDAPRFHERVHPGRFHAARAASRAAFARWGRATADVDVVEIHDAFTPFELMNLESMGFFPFGEGWRALARGELAVGGSLAVNPSGGMKARGHPIGVCGLTSMAEACLQLTGRAADRQQPNARAALIQSAGGVARDAYVFILEAA